MKIWSIQPVEVFNELLLGNKYRCDPAKSDMIGINPDLVGLNENFIKAYDFMANELNDVCTKPQHVKYPCWGWYKHNGMNTKPDYRDADFSYDQCMVGLELDIPSDRILLSTYDQWCIVLTGHVLNPECFTDNDFFDEKKYDEYEKAYEMLSEDNKQITLESSWRQIFYDQNIFNSRYVQAVFWEIDPKDVKDYQLINPKKKLNL